MLKTTKSSDDDSDDDDYAIGEHTKPIREELAVDDCSTKGVNDVAIQKSNEEMEKWCTEFKTGPNKLLLYDPSQHSPRFEEVRVAQAPLPEPNTSQDISDSPENFESSPDEEQLCEVSASAARDESRGLNTQNDGGITTQVLENDEVETDCTQNTDVAADKPQDEDTIAYRQKQCQKEVAARGAEGIDDHDAASQLSVEGINRHSNNVGTPNDTGYGSVESVELYQRVPFSFMRASVMLLGYDNAGKTCLSDTLLELPFRDPKKPEIHDSQSDQLDDLSNCKVTAIHAHTTGQNWTQLDESFGNALANDLETRRTEIRATEDRRCPEQKLTTSLKLLDMDGEFPFYQTHPMVMSKSMAFLVVMDITKKLDDDLPESTLAKEWKGKIEYPNTPRKFLDHWLTSISTFLHEHEQHQTTKSIIIVLTHTDKLDPKTRTKEIETFVKEVRSHVRKQHAAKYVEKTIIAVSNTDRHICRDELRKLKDTVLRLAESKPSFGIAKTCV